MPLFENTDAILSTVPTTRFSVLSLLLACVALKGKSFSQTDLFTELRLASFILSELGSHMAVPSAVPVVWSLVLLYSCG